MQLLGLAGNQLGLNTPKPHSEHTKFLLLAGERSACGATRGMEHRYHVYPAAKWICVSRCRHRLVQSPCTILSSFQQLGDELLPGCPRRCDRKARKAQNIQHRPGSAVHLERVHASDYWLEYSLQYGWSRSRIRQRVRGTAMEIGEV